MNLIKYFCIQLILYGVIILTGFYLESYHSKPFNFIKLMAIIIGIAILYIAFNLFNKAKKDLKPIRLFNKILLSVIAIIFAIVVIGVLTGEMQYLSLFNGDCVKEGLLRRSFFLLELNEAG